MISPLLIRPATVPLAPLLASLHAESFGKESWSIQQMRGSLGLETTQGWIAFEKGEPAGFILCQALPEQIEILTFCVRPSRRRRKIGESLLQHVIAAARTDSQKRIFLEVAADNPSARKLYEQLGFTLLGERQNYYRRGAVMINGLSFVLHLK